LFFVETVYEIVYIHITPNSEVYMGFIEWCNYGIL